MEIWKPIKGYENIYEISSMGRIKSLERVIDRYNSRFNKFYSMHLREKILTPSLVTNWYGLYVNLYSNGSSKNALVARLVADAFISNPANKPVVSYRDGDKSNLCVENLFWNDRIEIARTTGQTKAVLQIKDGNVIKHHDSIMEIPFRQSQSDRFL